VIQLHLDGFKIIRTNKQSSLDSASYWCTGNQIFHVICHTESELWKIKFWSDVRSDILGLVNDAWVIATNGMMTVNDELALVLLRYYPSYVFRG
jgi:hypothetical protein